MEAVLRPKRDIRRLPVLAPAYSTVCFRMSTRTVSRFTPVLVDSICGARPASRKPMTTLGCPAAVVIVCGPLCGGETCPGAQSQR